MRKVDIAQALISLVPEAQWQYEEEDYDSIVWLSPDIPKPSKKRIQEEQKRLQDEADALAYRDLRRPEYPDFREYLDGIVKNDQAQIDKYIAECLAVKKKYPKPKGKK